MATTTATPSAPTMTTARAFPLMYFVIALAFTGSSGGWRLSARGT